MTAPKDMTPQGHRERLTISIVVECDNLRTADITRTGGLFASLPPQIANVHKRLPVLVNEVLLVYNVQLLDNVALAQLRRYADALGEVDVSGRLLSAPGLFYYTLKNFGATQSNGDIIVFVDSDVIPESEWLEKLCQPFVEKEISVVAGNTYIDAHTLYEKVFAVTWFLPLRSQDGPLRETQYFFANNVAFERRMFLRYQYDAADLRYRGQCMALADRLRSDGLQLFLQPRARATHPAPNGVVHFVRKALCEGHDMYLNRARTRSSRYRRRHWCLDALWRFCRTLVRRWRVVHRGRRIVGLGHAELLGAGLILIVYGAVQLVGELLTGYGYDLDPIRV